MIFKTIDQNFLWVWKKIILGFSKNCEKSNFTPKNFFIDLNKNIMKKIDRK